MHPRGGGRQAQGHPLQHRPGQALTIAARFFAAARLDIEITDQLGQKVRTREWFLLPPSIIGEAVARLKDGSIVNYRYERDGGTLAQINALSAKSVERVGFDVPLDRAFHNLRCANPSHS
jgi:hypothetical protein